ncbi:hypothetical protein F5Y07DRAFT_309879 [Xylaria sp. FL0933]|nr:hypothetical protein F5Y07DRAFT_309879 [Xylaria sp. FL0933]
MSTYQYSGLEVAPGRAPEVVPNRNPPEVVPGRDPEVVPYYYDNKQNNYQSPTAPPPKGSRICGLSPRTFWIIFGVSTFLVIGSIVGGVAGGLVSRKHNSSSSSKEDTGMSASSTSPASTSSALASSSSPMPTTSTPTISTSTVVLPTTTLLRDCPSSNGTLYDVAYGSGAPLIFRKYCTAGFRHVLNGIDVLNEPTQSLNDCINACTNYNDTNKTAIATGNNQTCNAVCWRNNEQLDNINQIPGQCFGYTTLNTSAGFTVTDEVLCDSAAWINQRDL